MHEKWLTAIPLKEGVFTDAGYRFRKNEFTKSDYYWPFWGKNVVEFFDVVFYNNDPMKALPEHNYMANIYFRFDIDKVQHFRTVYKIMDWLGSIAGIEKFLLKWLTFVFGGFLQYNASIEIIN